MACIANMFSDLIAVTWQAFTDSRDGLARVLCFTNGDTDQFGSKVGENGCDHRTP